MLFSRLPHMLAIHIISLLGLNRIVLLGFSVMLFGTALSQGVSFTIDYDSQRILKTNEGGTKSNGAYPLLVRIKNKSGLYSKMSLEQIDIGVADMSVFMIQKGGFLQRIENDLSYQLYTYKDDQSTISEVLIMAEGRIISGYYIEDGQIHQFYVDPTQKAYKKQRLSIHSSKSDQNTSVCKAELSDYGVEAIKTRDKSKSSHKQVQIGIVLDFSFVQKAGSVSSALSKLIATIGSSTLDYADQFDVSLDLVISNVIISACKSCDPWSETNEVSQLQSEVIDWVKLDALASDDVVIFWTARDFDSDIIGSAYIGSVCSDRNTAILRDQSDVMWERRVLTSHELGHVLGSDHDQPYSQTIMSPSLVNSTQWSVSSLDAIDATTVSSVCLNNLEDVPCLPLDVDVDQVSYNEVLVKWSSNTMDSIHLKVEDYTSGLLIFEMTGIAGSSILVPIEIEPCQKYKFTISQYCPESTVLLSDVIWSSQSSNDIQLSDLMPVSCSVQDEATYYDLKLIINNKGTSSSKVNIWVKGIVRQVIAFSGQREYILPDIPSTGQLNVSVQLTSDDTEGYGCFDMFVYDEPTVKCAFQFYEDFNDCVQPSGWSVYSQGTPHQDFRWKFVDAQRDILNYGSSSNALSSKTIDGSCMALIDDDLINLADHSGLTYLESPAMDLSDLASAQLTFDFIFDPFNAKGAQKSYAKLQISVIGDSTWTDLWVVSNESCPWNDIWSPSCISKAIIPLDLWLQEGIRLRWNYSDGNEQQWAGMAAIDNIAITGLSKTNEPCSEVYIDQSPTNSLNESASMVYISTSIDVPSTQLIVSQGAILLPGSEIQTGTELNIEIESCSKP